MPISWNDTNDSLKTSFQFDVLLLMDCCFAARTVKGPGAKTMEVLCASSRESQANIDWTGSYFTSALIRNLKNCSSRTDGFLISELASLSHHDIGLEEQSPNYITISGHGSPIVVRPLNLPQIASPKLVSTLNSDPDDFTYMYNYEESLSEYLMTVEVLDKDSSIHRMNCLVDDRSKSNFISASTENWDGVSYRLPFDHETGSG